MKAPVILAALIIFTSCAKKESNDLRGIWSGIVAEEEVAVISINDSIFQTDKGDINVTSSYYTIDDTLLILHEPVEDKLSMAKILPSKLPVYDTFSLLWISKDEVRIYRKNGGYSFMKRKSDSVVLNYQLFDERLREKLEREWRDSTVKSELKRR